MKKSMWSFNFSTPALVLIPAAVGINFIGKFFTELLKLPLWLDSIGTVLASMLAGPITGAVAGLINNIIYGLTVDPISFIYGLTSIAIGIVTGVMAYKGFIRSWSAAAVLGIAVGFVATLVSTPINIIFWEGQTGNFWGDALYAVVLSSTNSVPMASFLDEIVVDIPDKLLTVLISYALFKAMPQNLRQLYVSDDSIEEL